MNFSKFSVTTQLIFITCVVSLIAFIIPSIYTYLQLTPSFIFGKLYLWTLLTHIFLHGSALHLFINMFSLWSIGRVSEKILGQKRFILLYFFGGLFVGIISAVLAYYFGNGIGANLFGTRDSAMVGASGAIFALAGLLAAVIPYSRVYLMLGPIIALILGYASDLYFKNPTLSTVTNLVIMIYVFFSISAMFSPSSRYSKLSLPLSIPLWTLPLVAIFPLIILSIFLPMNIGNVAHLSGFLVGLIYGIHLRQKYPNKIESLKRYFR